MKLTPKRKIYLAILGLALAGLSYDRLVLGIDIRDPDKAEVDKIIEESDSEENGKA